MAVMVLYPGGDRWVPLRRLQGQRSVAFGGTGVRAAEQWGLVSLRAVGETGRRSQAKAPCPGRGMAAARLFSSSSPVALRCTPRAVVGADPGRAPAAADPTRVLRRHSVDFGARVDQAPTPRLCAFLLAAGLVDLPAPAGRRGRGGVEVQVGRPRGAGARFSRSLPREELEKPQLRVRGRTPGLPPAGRPPVTSAVRPACSNGRESRRRPGLVSGSPRIAVGRARAPAAEPRVPRRLPARPFGAGVWPRGETT